MQDLAEHIGVVLWIASGLLVICGILIGLIWNDLKKKIGELKEEAKRFSEWLKKKGEEGGIVTRNLFYNWCSEQQNKCQAATICRSLNDWRNSMLDKGGIMSKMEHSVICKDITKEVTEHFCERIDELLEHHRQWFEQELKLLRAELTKPRV